MRFWFARRRPLRAGLGLGASFSLLVLAVACSVPASPAVPAAAMAHLGEEVPGTARARVMGLYIAANALGGMAGRLLSAVVSDLFRSWHADLGALGSIVCSSPSSSGCRQPAISSRAHCSRTARGRYPPHHADPGLPWLFSPPS